MVTMLAYVVLMLVLLSLIVGFALSSRSNVLYSSGELRSIRSGVLMLPNGSTQEARLPTVVEGLRPGDKLVLISNISSYKHDSLLYKVQDASLKIYVDDNVVAQPGQKGTYPDFQGTPPPYVGTVALPNNNAERTLRFEFTLSESAHSLELPVFYVGDPTMLSFQLFTANGLPLALALILLFGGASLVGISLLITRSMPPAMAFGFLGAFCLAAGIWSFCINDLVIYLIPFASVLYSLGFIGLLSIVAPMISFGEIIMRSEGFPLLRILSATACVLAILLIVLHLTGVLPFSVSRVAVRIYIPFYLVIFMADVIYEYYVLHNPIAKRLVFPCVLLVLFVIADLVNTMYVKAPLGINILQVGLFVFIFWLAILGWRTVRQTFEDAQRSKELAMEVEVISQNLDRQRTLYHNLTESTEKVRAMRHDMRHQLFVLRDYLKDGDTDEALEYIDQIAGAAPNLSLMLLTDNFVVNAVLSHYMAMAAEYNIHTDLQLVVPAELGAVSESDISIIFGNLFENAIEATAFLPESKRFVRMRCQAPARRLTLTVDNSFDGYYRRQDNSFYSRKRPGRGIGLSSVQTIVERYDGSMKIEAANGVFMVSLYVMM
ncbi:MAG: GHKL domain-containing protein [Actinomycetia bacterium]|nr:GHKL domain-containing protein [Actinomycetes bacterium]